VININRRKNYHNCGGFGYIARYYKSWGIVGVKFTNSGLSFSLFYFFIFIFISFYFLIFLFLEHRIRVKSQDAENKVEGSRTSDIIQHRYYMLTLCTIHSCLG